MKIVKIVKDPVFECECSRCGRTVKKVYVTDSGDMYGSECIKRELGIPIEKIKQMELPEFYKCKLYEFKGRKYIITDNCASSSLGFMHLKTSEIEDEYIYLKPWAYREVTVFKKSTPQWKIDKRIEWTRKHFNI